MSSVSVDKIMDIKSYNLQHKNGLFRVITDDVGYYQYKLTDIIDEESIKQNALDNSSVSIIQDFSWSMKLSNSDKSAYIALISTCTSLFDNGFKTIRIALFGGDTYMIEVSREDYEKKIQEGLDNYLDIDRHTLCKAKFDIRYTRPDIAFHNIIESSTKKNNYVIFMTDGVFNGKDRYHYEREWKRQTREIKKSEQNYQFMVIGYQNDSLEQIQSMDSTFREADIKLQYVTIAHPDEIKNSMELYASQVIERVNGSVEITLGDHNVNIRKGETFYTTHKIKGMMEPIDYLESFIEKGVTLEWIKEVYNHRLQMMIFLNNCRNELAEGANMMDVFEKMVKYQNIILKNYMRLRSKVKGIKSRKIQPWRDFISEHHEYLTFMRFIQYGCSDDLTEKKKYEIKTNMQNQMATKHILSIQRRVEKNKGNVHEVEFNADVNEGENKITFTSMKNGEIIDVSTSDMKCDISDLNDAYSCFFTAEDWSELLPSLMGIPIKYIWKENDDWNPSISNIEHVNESTYISDDGYSELQDIFSMQYGTSYDEIDHKILFGDKLYISDQLTKMNFYIPLAIEPNFIKKSQLIMERLALTITGSSYGSASRHINFYIAVIKQAIKQYINNPSGKAMKNIALLLYTYKVLFDKFTGVYDIDNSVMKRDVIIYNIGRGETSRTYFDSAYHVACLLTISDMKDIKDGLKLYNREYCSNLSIDEWICRLWKMVYRAFIIESFNSSYMNDWTEPETWGLTDRDEVYKIVSELETSKVMEHVEKHMMTNDKLTEQPEVVESSINKFYNSLITNVYNVFGTIDKELKESKYFYNVSSNPLGPFDLSKIRKPQVLEAEMKQIIFNTFWECELYGQKDCYPYREHDAIKSQIVSRINTKYGDVIRVAVKNGEEYHAFIERDTECEYLPSVFTQKQTKALNKLFINTYGGEYKKEEFVEKINGILDEYTKNGIKHAIERGVDPLENLYEYCKRTKNRIIIKDNGLPESAPSNPTSPKFLQYLSNEEFNAYFKPLGFGWQGKKYRCWIDDLHPFMKHNVQLWDREQFINLTTGHTAKWNLDSPARQTPYEMVKDYAGMYYDTFHTK
jgi:hypothetical protein